MSRRPGPARHVVVAVLSTVVSATILVGTAGVALAVPPPPPNPSDQQIQGGKADAHRKAARVGTITNRLAAAESRLEQLQAEVETKMEDANKALVDLQDARSAAAAAERAAQQAHVESVAAGRDIDTARDQLDAFAAASYRQRSVVGSISAYLGARSPEDLLQRAQLLNAVSSSQLDALQVMQQAQVHKANKDSATRAALALAQRKRVAAEQAKATADQATAAAEQARAAQAGENSQLQAAKADYERQLYAAQVKVTGLQTQRQRYQSWLAAKEREDAARAQQAGGGRHHHVSSGVGSRSVRAVIARALGALGTVYAWGGGNAYGPTRGIRDGGVADYYGDYNKVGFDCSGLMVYAFAAAGVRLPHYSGYQAAAGRRVPLSRMAPGDLLFYADGGAIHHVALYLGNGQMVEAPYSGSRVRIAPVRYGGIVPYATRVL